MTPAELADYQRRLRELRAERERVMSTGVSHPRCHGPAGHVCQQPSGRKCIDCGLPAGTLWGPLWCPDCDVKRLDRISASLYEIRDSLR